MQINFLQGLAAKVGSIITVSAIVFLTILSTISYQYTFQNEIRSMKHSLSQLVVTVESSAAIASYLNNLELATDVVEGLARNDMVSGVSISGTSGLYFFIGNMTSENKVEIQSYPVLSPVDNQEPVGEIRINLNQKLIEQRARDTAKIEVLNIAIQTLLIVALVIFLVYWLLTKPIHFVAKQLHLIQPGGKNILQIPDGHKKNEIGDLVRDTNHLLITINEAFAKEKSLREQVEVLERRFRLIFEHASGGIALTDTRGKLILHNPSFNKLIGNTITQELKEPGNKFLPDIFVEQLEVRNILQQLPVDSLPIAIDLELIKYEKENKNRWLHSLFSSVRNEEGELLIEIICYDISERTLREQKTQREADHDPLTKLLNRRGGMQQLDSILEKCKSKKQRFAIFMIDLDKFKPINDTFGHESGDKVLCTIAERLLETVRHKDKVIRLGGDEFLIALTEGHNGLDPIPVANRALESLSEEIEIKKGELIKVGGSIGISIYPENGETLSTLIDKADDAMYKIKNEGRNGYCFSEK